jgi:CheY-like chemotaxis protein
VCERPPRILIIEDELLIALMIEEMVREIGYRVSGVAHTMAMAGQELAKRNYDAVLLDFNIDGRYHAKTADQLTGWGKPFAPEHLRALLEDLVGQGSLPHANGI